MVDEEVIADAGRLRESLGKLPEPVVRPSLVMVAGLPGTGKSHFCRALAERHPLLILESDALRQVLFPSPAYTSQESSRLFRAIHYLIEELLKKGIPLILDATNLAEPYRERLYNVTDRLNARLIIVRIEAPPNLVRERLRARTGAGAPENHSEADWSVYQKMKTTVQTIRRNYFAVDTSRDITPVLNKIVREINR